MTGRVTLPWTLLCILLATGVGLLINGSTESRWIAPVAMGMLMCGLMVYGRVPGRRPDEDG